MDNFKNIVQLRKQPINIKGWSDQDDAFGPRKKISDLGPLNSGLILILILDKFKDFFKKKKNPRLEWRSWS